MLHKTGEVTKINIIKREDIDKDIDKKKKIKK